MSDQPKTMTPGQAAYRAAGGSGNLTPYGIEHWNRIAAAAIAASDKPTLKLYMDKCDTLDNVSALANDLLIENRLERLSADSWYDVACHFAEENDRLKQKLLRKKGKK